MKKALGLMLIAAMVIMSCKKPDGHLKGVVTYFFNNNFGDKPDVGAKIYAIKKDDFDEKKIKSIKDFLAAKAIDVSRQIIQVDIHSDSLDINTKTFEMKYEPENVKLYTMEIEDIRLMIAAKQKKIDSITATMAPYNAETPAKYHTLDSLAFANITLLETDPKAVKASADGNGNYNLTAAPGEYYVLAVSNNRKGLTLTTIEGNIKLDNVTIESEKDANYDAKFDLE